MKLLCLDCDDVMCLEEPQFPGDGTLAAVFACATCSHEVALLTNPGETRLLSGLGVRIGGRAVPEQPMELVRSSLRDGRDDAFVKEAPVDAPTEAPANPAAEGPPSPGTVTWSPEARARLERVPGFVRGMVERVCVDHARAEGMAELTPEIMDQVRSTLGIEGM